MERPEMEVVEVLNYYDGVIEFLARYVERIAESTPIYRVAYGCLADNSSVSTDENRTYDVWSLPPVSDRKWKINEDELEFAEADQPKSECPYDGCAATFVGDRREADMIDHYLRDHGLTM